MQQLSIRLSGTTTRPWAELTDQEQYARAFKASLSMIAWCRDRDINPDQEHAVGARAALNLRGAGGMTGEW
jgi:hypothetical protein